MDVLRNCAEIFFMYTHTFVRKTLKCKKTKICVKKFKIHQPFQDMLSRDPSGQEFLYSFKPAY